MEEPKSHPQIVTVYEAKTNLSRLLARVEAGEEFIIARGKKPIGRLVPEVPAKAEPRKRGDWKGLIQLGPEFFEPLPEDELRAWGEIE
jgi:antitoxin (DNA-binding transcriptional repressor) of toxin-antitoxin stability system